MSNHTNEVYMEGLADEFYDDPAGCIKWLVQFQAAENDNINVAQLTEEYLALTEEEQCEKFVSFSMNEIMV